MDIFGSLPESDLNEISPTFLSNYSELENVNFIIVGASGFLGTWLSAYLTYLHDQKIFSGTLTFVVRDENRMPKLSLYRKAKSRRIVDIKSLEASSFSHLDMEARLVVIYAATSTSLSGSTEESQYASALDLPEKLIQLIPSMHTTFIHLSSGGIYKTAARKLNAIPGNTETQETSHDLYVQEKIELEKWSSSKAVDNLFLVRNPRLFAFYGPGLQLDRHFAIGEFISRGRAGLPITLNGASSNLRSYLYPTDAIKQILLQCLIEKPMYSQIGSSIPRTILQVSEVIANMYETVVEESGSQDLPVNNYVPMDVPVDKEKDFYEGLATWDQWLNL